VQSHSQLNALFNLLLIWCNRYLKILQGITNIALFIINKKTQTYLKRSTPVLPFKYVPQSTDVLPSAVILDLLTHTNINEYMNYK